ncbi:MAG: hypothetical protein ACE5LU_10630, partial [Anaerolineae bacterium]
APNLLRVVVQGSEINLYINGVLQATVTDGTFSDGQLALIATNLADTEGADIYFDNLTVYRVGERPVTYLPVILRNAQ